MSNMRMIELFLTHAMPFEQNRVSSQSEMAFN